jgi:hypothetical protein
MKPTFKKHVVLEEKKLLNIEWANISASPLEKYKESNYHHKKFETLEEYKNETARLQMAYNLNIPEAHLVHKKIDPKFFIGKIINKISFENAKITEK